MVTSQTEQSHDTDEKPYEAVDHPDAFVDELVTVPQSQELEK
jgi:hypothetical protein